MTNTPHIKYQHVQLGWDNNNNKKFQKSMVSAEFLTLILTVNFWQKITNMMCFNKSVRVTVNTFWNPNMKDCCCNLRSHRWELTLWAMFTCCRMCACAMHIHPKTTGPQKGMLFSTPHGRLLCGNYWNTDPFRGTSNTQLTEEETNISISHILTATKIVLSCKCQVHILSPLLKLSSPCHLTEQNLGSWNTPWLEKIIAWETLTWKTLLSVQHEQTKS